MDKENYRKVVKICEKGRCKMKVIINSCLLTELLKNFQTSLDNMRVIGETYSVEDMNELVEEFAKFNIKPDDIIGKTIIFKCQSISAYA